MWPAALVGAALAQVLAREYYAPRASVRATLVCYSLVGGAVGYQLGIATFVLTLMVLVTMHLAREYNELRWLHLFERAGCFPVPFDPDAYVYPAESSILVLVRALDHDWKLLNTLLLLREYPDFDIILIIYDRNRVNCRLIHTEFSPRIHCLPGGLGIW